MMTTLLILFGFIGSVSFTLLLRRLDRSNLKLNQIRRFGENQSTQIEELSARQVRAIKDATIEFELLFRQSHQAHERLESGLSDYALQLDRLQKEREAVQGISEELDQISKSSSAVIDHVERLDSGLARLSLAETEMNDIHDRIEHLSRIVDQRGIESETKLSQITGRIIRENEERGMRLAENFESIIDEMRDKIVVMDDQLTDRKRDYELVGERINTLTTRLDEKWILEAGRIDDKFGGIEKKLQERFHSLEAGLASIRTSSVESLQAEVSRIRSEIEGFNLSTMAKRDEILNETRRMAEGISDQIRLFQEKSIETENRLLRFAEQEKHAIRERIASYDEEWSGMEERHMDELEERIHGLEALIDNNRDSRIENLQTEYHKTREEFRTLVRNVRDEFQNEAEGIQKSIGQAVRDEEKNLITAKSELERLREELSESGRDANASLRNECDHAISLIRETRISEIDALNRSRDELLRARNEVYERLEGLEDQMREASRIHQKIDDHVGKIKEELVDAGEGILSDLDVRANKILSEQDVKLEKLGRTIDDGISRHLAQLMDSGQLKIDELEKRTMEMLRNTTTRMEDDLQNARDEFRKIREAVGDEMDKARTLRDDILQEISRDTLRLQKFQDRLEIVNQAEILVQRLDEAVEILSDRLDLAREENAKMDGYMKNLETVRLTRQELENELKRLDEQREKLVETERHLRAVELHVEGLYAKFEDLANSEALAESIEERAEKLSAYKETFDNFFFEMSEKKKYIENSIRFIEKSKQQVRESKDLAEKLLQRVERAELRQEEIGKVLEEIESRTSRIGNMDSEVQKVEARFEQMEGLMRDLENRQKQIGAMSRRMEDLKTGGDEVRIELESILSEADEKMDKLSAFYQTIEKMLEQSSGTSGFSDEIVGEKSSKRRPAQSAVAEWKREGILSLYLNHKWEPDLIADKMKIDPAVVRAVISSHS